MLDQRAQRVAGIEVALAVAEVVPGQQDLRCRHSKDIKQVGIDAHELSLSDRAEHLLGWHRLAQIGEVQPLAPGCLRPRSNHDGLIATAMQMRNLLRQLQNALPIQAQRALGQDAATQLDDDAFHCTSSLRKANR